MECKKSSFTANSTNVSSTGNSKTILSSTGNICGMQEILGFTAIPQMFPVLETTKFFPVLETGEQFFPVHFGTIFCSTGNKP